MEKVKQMATPKPQRNASKNRTTRDPFLYPPRGRESQTDAWALFTIRFVTRDLEPVPDLLMPLAYKACLWAHKRKLTLEDPRARRMVHEAVRSSRTYPPVKH